MSDKTMDKIWAVIIPLPILAMAIFDVCWYYEGVQTFEATFIHMFFYLIAYMYIMVIIALIKLYRGEK